MKRYFILVALLFWATQLAYSQTSKVTQAAPNAPMDSVVQRLGKEFIKQPARVGLSIGIIKNGQTYFYNFGTTEKGKNQAPTQNTVFEIGSVSKTFTSLLLAHAVIEKKVNLTDDIRKYMGGDYANLAYKGKPIQLVHLANTTSSLPDNLPDLSGMLQKVNPDSVGFVAVRSLRNYTKQDFYKDLHTVRLDTVPGLVPRHSNVATQLLAYILEQVYQTSYDQLIEKYIERPLAMKRETAAEASFMASGYNENGSIMPVNSIKAFHAAGGLRYSSADMLKYIKYQLAGTDKALILSHQATWGNINEQAIGFNWNMIKTVDSKRRLFHSGGTFGFASYCDLYPELGFGIILLSNESDRSTQTNLEKLSETIVEGIYGVPPALKAFQNSLVAHDYDQAMGLFETVKKKYPELHLTEDFVNNWGYALARQGKVQQAIELFKLNVSLYPRNWNTYDSLAEAYEMAGNRTLSVENYKRSLALNPQNTGAVEHLKKLGGATGQ
ncbi:MAG TPA: serine hydrolase [Hymenobacter sp.]